MSSCRDRTDIKHYSAVTQEALFILGLCCEASPVSPGLGWFHGSSPNYSLSAVFLHWGLL